MSQAQLLGHSRILFHGWISMEKTVAFEVSMSLGNHRHNNAFPVWIYLKADGLSASRTDDLGSVVLVTDKVTAMLHCSD